MIEISAVIALAIMFQSPGQSGSEGRLRSIVQAAFPAVPTVRGFVFEPVRVSTEVVVPPAADHAKDRAEGRFTDLRYYRPPGPVAYATSRGFSVGPRHLAHRLSFSATVYGSLEAANHRMWMNGESNPGRYYKVAHLLPSGYPAGDSVEVPKVQTSMQNVRYLARDGNLIVVVNFWAGQRDPRQQDSRPRQAPPDIVETVEGLTRQILARAQAARAGLAGAQTTGGRQAPQRRAAGVAFAGFDRPANLKAGIFTFRQGTRTVVAPLSAYEIRVNGRPIKLKQPVMEADGRIWIEAAALR